MSSKKLNNPIELQRLDEYTLSLQSKWESDIYVTPDCAWAIAFANGHAWPMSKLFGRKPQVTFIHLRTGVQSEFSLPANNGYVLDEWPYDVHYFTSKETKQCEISLRFGSQEMASVSNFLLEADGRVIPCFQLSGIFSEEKKKVFFFDETSINEGVKFSSTTRTEVFYEDEDVRLTVIYHPRKIICAGRVNLDTFYSRDVSNLVLLTQLLKK